MSATRDKSQSVGFVYTNVYALYKKAKQEKNSNVNAESAVNSEPSESTARVLQTEELSEVKVARFQPRTLTPGELPPETQAKLAAQQKPAQSFNDLKANIERLEDLHARLRFMLKELEDLVGNKK